MFRKGHSYNVAGAKIEPRGVRVGSGPEVTGTFKRNDSIAQRGGLRVKKLIESEGQLSNANSAPSSRRGSDSSLGKNILGVISDIHSRRSSTPNISLDVGQFRLDNHTEAVVDTHNKRQSTYLELLEEVVSELNLKDLKNVNECRCDATTASECCCDINNAQKEEEFVQIAFEFLNDMESDYSQVFIKHF